MKQNIVAIDQSFTWKQSVVLLINQLFKNKKKALICSTHQFPWCSPPATTDSKPPQ